VLEAGFTCHRRIPISFRTLIVEIGKPAQPVGHYSLKMGRNE